MSETSDAVLEAIAARRSVRAFTDEAVPDDVVTRIIEAGRCGPTGGNRQMARYIAVRSGNMIARMRECVVDAVAELRTHVTSSRAGDQFDGYTSMFTHFDKAPCVICVLGKPYDSIFTRILGKYVPEDARPIQKGVDVAAMSVAASIENMLLAASALSYGACFMTGPLVAQERLERLLGIDDPWHLVALIPVGRPAGTRGQARDRGNIDDVLTFV